MITTRRLRLLAELLIPLGGFVLIYGLAVGDPIEIAFGTTSVTFGILISAYFRRRPDATIESLQPTLGTAIVRNVAMIGIFTAIVELGASFSTVDPATLTTRPSILLAGGAIGLGAILSVAFSVLGSRVDHTRAIQAFEVLVVAGLFAGLLVTAPATALPFAGAFVIGRLGVLAYYFAWPQGVRRGST